MQRDPIELNFEGLEMLKLNNPTDGAQGLDEENLVNLSSYLLSELRSLKCHKRLNHVNVIFSLFQGYSDIRESRLL